MATTKKNVIDYKTINKNDIPVCDDWKDRLKQEYTELKERHEKLRKYNTKNRVETSCNILSYESSYKVKRYRANLMEEQEEAMYRYLRLLEERMTLEGIDY